MALAQFAKDDGVSFSTSDGLTKQALAQRLNSQTASLLTDDGERGKVLPGLLRKHLLARAKALLTIPR